MPFKTASSQHSSPLYSSPLLSPPLMSCVMSSPLSSLVPQKHSLPPYLYCHHLDHHTFISFVTITAFVALHANIEEGAVWFWRRDVPT
mmetsp:Transcript_2714/g.3977  ORF Transcript_2714/g.3977 Transcript_2714/m.3977 type:complete len:88 (+) Transcript_2714:69-332(+)